MVTSAPAGFITRLSYVCQRKCTLFRGRATPFSAARLSQPLLPLGISGRGEQGTNLVPDNSGDECIPLPRRPVSHPSLSGARRECGERIRRGHRRAPRTRRTATAGHGRNPRLRVPPRRAGSRPDTREAALLLHEARTGRVRGWHCGKELQESIGGVECLCVRELAEVHRPDLSERVGGGSPLPDDLPFDALLRHDLTIPASRCSRCEEGAGVSRGERSKEGGLYADTHVPRKECRCSSSLAGPTRAS